MKKKTNWKLLLNLAGFVIGIAGVIFVIRKFMEFSDRIQFSSLSGLVLASLAGLVLAYGCANILQSLAWGELLKHLGIETPARWTVQTYGISQIAKYVPGNIFQFAGRQAIGQAAGFPALPLARSAVWEIGLLAFTGTFFSLLVIPLFWGWMSYLLAAGLFLAAIVIAMLLQTRWIGRKVASAMRLDVLFLVSAGIIFYGVLVLTTRAGTGGGLTFIGITGVYVIAWLAGLVTPGAPAGIGVREVVFLTILHPVIPDGELLKAIILGRCVTVGGDVLFYIFALVLRLSRKE